MVSESHNQLIRRYEAVSFSVMKKAEYLIKDEISEDLTNDQHATLRFIKTYESCTSTELAEAFFVKKSAITAIINRLYEKGLIDRTRDENDRRVIYLSLSKAGEELFERSERKIHQLVEAIILKFKKEEIEQFLDTYEKLSTILDSMIHHQG